MSEWTVNPRRKLLSCRHCQCGRILTERTKSKRGIAAPCGWPPYTKRASHKKCSVFRLFTLGEWRTDGPRAQIWATTNSSWVAFQALAGPLLPVVSGSFLLWSPLPGTLYHLQLLSDRNFVRALLVHLQPRSWFTCNLDLSSPATWIQSLTRVSISRKSREEMTHIYLSRAGELYFHFSFQQC